MCDSLTADDVRRTFKTQRSIQHDDKYMSVEQSGGGNRESVHIVKLEEQVAFADWINKHLGGDQDLHHLLPLDETGDDLYEKIDDGILLCKIINKVVPNTIEEKKINKGKKLMVFKVS